MTKFAKNRTIEQVKIPAGHATADKVETVMKPLGKTMKTAVCRIFLNS